MPLDPSISLQVQTPNPTGYIGSLLDLGLKKNALTRSNATLLSDIAQSKAQSSIAQTGANVAAQTAQPTIDVAQEQAKQQAIQTELQKYHLTGEYSQKALDTATSLIQDPDIQKGNGEGIIDKLTAAKQQVIAQGVPARTAEVMFAPLVTLAATQPQQVQQRLAQMIKSGQGAQGQAAQSLVPAITQQQVAGLDARNNPTVQQRDEFGNVHQESLPQGAPQPGAQPSPVQPQGQVSARPLQYPPGENPDTYKQLSAERDVGRQTVLAAPTVHKLNGEILSELDKATTGQYSGIIAKAESLAGMMGLSLKGDNELERAASAYDLVDKYTTMAATRAAQSMGNDTATALNAQLKQNASVERNPTAIKKSIKLNDAILSGAEAYQQGLEHSIQANPQADVFIKRKFDQTWAQNFDPVIMQIYQAKKSGDTAELADLVKGLGNRAPDIARKAQVLQTLIQKGLSGG